MSKSKPKRHFEADFHIEFNHESQYVRSSTLYCDNELEAEAMFKSQCRKGEWVEYITDFGKTSHKDQNDNCQRNP